MTQPPNTVQGLSTSSGQPATPTRHSAGGAVPSSPSSPSSQLPGAPGASIEVRGLTKRFGSFTAVDSLDFTVAPGRITGFLGPNGAGKTTTLRMLLGLVSPTSGTATIDGRSYHDLREPMREVGSALESTNFHPGRSGRDHLRVLADASGIPVARADEMLELVGIPAAARKRAGGYSMGMRQRLGLAAALLGDPRVLILDEPTNGLDPEGIRWLRGFLRHLSGQGKTILVSSHLLQEVAQTVDDVVIIANGVSVAQGPIASLQGESVVVVRSPRAAELAGALRGAGLTLTDQVAGDTPDTVRVSGADAARVGDVAFSAGLPVHELRALGADLESLYFRLTAQPENADRNRRTPAGAGAGGPGTAGPHDAPTEGARR